MTSHRLPCALLLLGAALVRASSALAVPEKSPAPEASPPTLEEMRVADPRNASDPAGDIGSLSITFENDTFADTDHYYSSGLRLAWRPSAEPPAWLATVGHWLARPVMPEAPITWGLAVGQNIYTPRDLSDRNPERDDRPFAGWLHATLGVSSATETDLATMEVSLGVIGSSAGAEGTQDFFHKLANDNEDEGWNRQIDDQPAALITLERRWAARRAVLGDDLEADVVPAVGINLGNVQTSAAVGLLARFGHRLDVDFGPPRIRPALSGIGVFRRPSSAWAFYAFVGAEGRAVAYDETLDGNDEGYWRIDREPLVGELSAGAELVYRALHISFAMIAQSATFDEQTDEPFLFGSLQLSIAF